MKLTKTIVRKYVNSVLFNGAKVQRISTLNKDCIIFNVKLTKGKMIFCPTFLHIQSVSYHSEILDITYYILKNDYKYIINKIKSQTNETTFNSSYKTGIKAVSNNMPEL